MFNIDVEALTDGQFDTAMYERYVALRSRMDGLNLCEGDYDKKLLGDISSWILMNFANTRAMKHMVVETKNFRLSKFDGKDITFYRKGYSRFGSVSISMEYLEALLREMWNDEEYMSKSEADMLGKIRMYLIACLFKMYCKNGSYHPEFRYQIVDKMTVRFKYDRVDTSSCKIDNDGSEIAEVGGVIKICDFEYEGKKYSMGKAYDLFAEKTKRYDCDADSLLYCSLLDCDDAKLYKSSEGSTMRFDNYVYSRALAKYDTQITILRIDDYEKVIDKVAESCKVIQEIDGCGLLFGVGDSKNNSG